MAKAPSKKPFGRPTLYRPEYCELLIKHMAKGFSYETFGAQLDCSKQTVYDWEKHPAFLDAKRQAFSKCQEFWENLALQYMVSDPKGPALNSSVWIFNMKNRFRWADRIEQSVTADVKTDDHSKELAGLKALIASAISERKK